MRVVFSKTASADLQAIRDYISRDDPKAAERVSSAILKACTRLRLFPRSARTGDLEGTRELVVRSYVVVYQIEGRTVGVLRVRHGARDQPEA